MTLRCVSPSCRFLTLYYDIIHTMGAQSDMLMWLISEIKGVERSLEGWARRLFNLDFTSVQTTSLVSLQRAPFLSSIFHRFLITASKQTFTHSFYRLLAHPGYIDPLRGEVEAVVVKEGWTRAFR
jgi:hypothetical protein